MDNTCQSANCKTSKSTTAFSRWLPALVLAILPKCPFCILAFSGASALCSGNMLYPNAGSWGGYVAIGIAFFVMFMLLLNYKGGRTIWAIFVTLVGIGLLTVSQFVAISQATYYAGVGLLFLGIWLNGSLPHFYRRWNAKIINYITNKTSRT